MGGGRSWVEVLPAVASVPTVLWQKEPEYGLSRHGKAPSVLLRLG